MQPDLGRLCLNESGDIGMDLEVWDHQDAVIARRQPSNTFTQLEGWDVRQDQAILRLARGHQAVALQDTEVRPLSPDEPRRFCGDTGQQARHVLAHRDTCIHL
jgi:hypothetical protein